MGDGSLIKEKTIGAIQRDRLSDFLAEVDVKKGGCFYISLLSSWARLFPTNLIDRKFGERVTSSNAAELGVKPNEVVGKIEQLHDLFHLKVTKIGVTGFANESLDEIRAKFRFQSDIELFKYASERYEPLNSTSDGIILWQHPDKTKPSHFTSLSPSERFGGLERNGGNIGGQEGADKLFAAGFSPLLVFHVSKTT